MFNSNGPSLADIAAVTGNRNNDGFGEGNGWWILIILFAIFGGWGNNSYGNNRCNDGSGSRSVYEGYVLQNDFSQLERKADYIQNGICDSTYALNNTVQNGFANLNLALSNQGYETRNAINGIGSQLASCCCEIKTGMMENRYLDAQNFANLNNTLCGIGRDIVENQNNNYRALHDELVADRMEAKNAQIAELQLKNQQLLFAASQQAQNNYLVSALRPCPIPSYTVPNPYCCSSNVNTYNCCNGCGQ